MLLRLQDNLICVVGDAPYLKSSGVLMIKQSAKAKISIGFSLTILLKMPFNGKICLSHLHSMKGLIEGAVKDGGSPISRCNTSSPHKI
jgi:hypothetical protein